jgi:hypothetical protein
MNYKSLFCFGRGTYKIGAGRKVGGIALNKKNYIIVQKMLKSFALGTTVVLVYFGISEGETFRCQQSSVTDQSDDAANYLL